MAEGLNQIEKKITAFRRKYYFNLFLRGSILTVSLVLVYYLVAAIVEYNFWLGGTARFIIFGSFIALVLFCLYRFVKEPILFWLYRRGLGEEESAKIIGASFPSIHDRLLNVIQLSKESQKTALLLAGINQKSREFEGIPFESAVDLRENRRYVKYFAIPFILILLLWVFNHKIFTQSTTRIVQFNREFSPEAPFRFIVQNENLNAFFNEDFVLNLKLEGEALPDAVYIVTSSQRIKMEAVANEAFSYTFDKLQNGVSFQFEASGFLSDPINIALIKRPELEQLNVELRFPSYLGRKPEFLSNAASLEVPEGTLVKWLLDASHATDAKISFASQSGAPVSMQRVDDQSFQYSDNINNPDQYSIYLENEHSKNRDQISYAIQVIKDQYPELTVEQLQDSALYKTVMLGGAVKDDHGITDLKVQYEIVRGSERKPVINGIRIPLNENQPGQNFFFQWNLDSLRLQPGDQLNYYLQVWDNDGVNGRKSTKSSMYQFHLPSDDELKAEITRSQAAAQSQINQSMSKAKELRDAIDEAQQKLRGKQNLDWQDKKMLEDLIEQKKGLDQAIEQLQKQNDLLEQKKENFSEESERIKEKSEQIQKLMNELLDEETKKMFDELEKLLKENADLNQMQKLLNKMDKKEINLEKELERTLELFKQLQYDYKLEQAIDEIRQQASEQESLLEKTQELSGEKKEEKPSKEQKSQLNNNAKQNEDQQKKSEKGSSESDPQKKDGKDEKQGDQKPEPEQLAKRQEELEEKFKKFEKTVDDLEKLGEELKEETDTPSDEEMQEVKDAQQQSKEMLNQGKPKKASDPQKKSLSKMKEMENKLQGMQNNMEMQMDDQNLETLRQIIHGLIKLSFDQEGLMKEFGPIQQTDPRYIQLSQNQLKVRDDAKVLEDSLLSLGKRDPFMGSIVTREVGELNDHIEKSVENIKERRKPMAASEMQLSMTSINNLALMLNDHFSMMMDMMANAKPSKGKKPGKQKSLGEIQQQLNQQIEQMKNGGKSGKELSEELAKMAAEQERIRRALQEMQEKLKQEGGKPLGNDLPGKMEQTEMELVNKQITEQTIQRQKEILTRLLESEKSMREQKMDEERKGETAKDYQKEIPRAFEEYLRLKEKELELLKTVPPKLYPYYKKEVSEYFKRVGTN